MTARGSAVLTVAPASIAVGLARIRARLSTIFSRQPEASARDERVGTTQISRHSDAGA
jgi:hypothetical protein